jgi:hypothetical protein
VEVAPPREQFWPREEPQHEHRLPGAVAQQQPQSLWLVRQCLGLREWRSAGGQELGFVAVGDELIVGVAARQSALLCGQLESFSAVEFGLAH